MKKITKKVAVRGVSMFESLEARKLFAAVAWTGAGDGVSWGVAANWSGNAVPTLADDVTIDAPGVTVKTGGNRVAKSLQLRGMLELANDNGATLDEEGLTLDGNLTLVDGATVKMKGTSQPSLMFRKGNSDRVIGGSGQVIAERFGSSIRLASTSLLGDSGSYAMVVDSGVTITGNDNLSLNVLLSSTTATPNDTLEVRGTVTGVTLSVDPFFNLLQRFDRVRNQNVMVLSSQSSSSATPMIENMNSGNLTLTGTNIVSVNNSGTLNLRGGKASIDLDTASQSGTVNLESGTIAFTGTFTQAEMGVINRTGGVVEIAAGSVLTGDVALNAATGSYVFKFANNSFARLRDGRLSTVEGASFGGVFRLENSSLSGIVRVAGVATAGTISITDVRTSGSFTLETGAELVLQNANLGFDDVDSVGSATIGGSGTVRLLVGSIVNDRSDAGSVLTVGSGVSIVEEGQSSSTVRGGFSAQGSRVVVEGPVTSTGGGISIANSSIQGPVTSTGGVISIANSSVQGPVTSGGGGISVSDASLGSRVEVNGGSATFNSVSFGGSVVLNSTSAIFGGGTDLGQLAQRMVRTGGSVRIGDVDYTGDFALSDSTGSWDIANSTLRGGTYTAAGAAKLVVADNFDTFGNLTLVGYVVGADLDVTKAERGTIRVMLPSSFEAGPLTLTLANNARITLGSTSGSATGKIRFVNQTTEFAVFNVSGALLGGSGSVIFGGAVPRVETDGDSIPQRIENAIVNGLFPNGVDSDTSDSDLAEILGSFAPGAFDLTIGEGVTIRGRNGQFTGTGGSSGGEDLSGGASFQRIRNRGMIAPDVSTATFGFRLDTLNEGRLVAGRRSLLSFERTLTNAASGVISVAIAGTSARTFGVVEVTGALRLGGTLAASFSNARFDLPDATALPVLTAGEVSGRFAVVDSPLRPAGNRLSVVYEDSDGIVSLQADAVFAPTTPVLVAGSDTGASATDRITSDNTLTVTGEAEVGAVVSILADGEVVGTGVAVGGTYTITTSVLADGVRVLRARSVVGGAPAQNSAGGLSVTVDTVGPTISVPVVPVASGGVTSGVEVSFALPTASDAFDSAPVVSVGGVSGAVYPLGQTTVPVTATDLAGNVSSSGILIEVRPPVVVGLGSLDTTFGRGTGVVLDVIPGVNIVSIDQFAFGDGKVLAAGFDLTANQLVFTRYNADGSKDGSFGTAGVLRAAIPAGFGARKVQFDQGTGLVYVLGTSGQSLQPGILRFTQAGVVDGAFGAGGLLLPVTLTPADRVDSILQVGKGFVIGGSVVRGSTRSALVMRITAANVLDTKFATRGVYTREGGPLDTISGITQGPRGVLIVTGTTSSGNIAENAVSAGVLVLRFSAAGKLDLGFSKSTRGVFSLTVPGFGLASGQQVLVQPSGRIVVSANVAFNAASALAGRFGGVLVRINPNGTLDTTFNGTGVLVNNEPPPAPVTSGVRSLAVVGLATVRVGAIADLLDAAQSSFVRVPGGRIRSIALRQVGRDTLLKLSQLVEDSVDIRARSVKLSGVAAGRPVKGGAKLQAQVTLANVGTLPAKGTLQVEAFLSLDTALGGNDFSLVTLSPKISARAGQTFQVKVPIVLPSRNGPFFVIVRVGGSDSIVNLTPTIAPAVTASSISIQTPVPRLAGMELGELVGGRPLPELFSSAVVV